MQIFFHVQIAQIRKRIILRGNRYWSIQITIYEESDSYYVDRYYIRTIWNHRKRHQLVKKYHHHNFRFVDLVDPKLFASTEKNNDLFIVCFLFIWVIFINIYNGKVNKIESQLADIGWHHFNLELATFYIGWHESRKVGWYEVCDVVLDFLIARCNDCIEMKAKPQLIIIIINNNMIRIKSNTFFNKKKKNLQTQQEPKPSAHCPLDVPPFWWQS